MAQARLRGRVSGTAGDELAPPELRVLRLIAEGRSDKQIGVELHNSHHTIHGHTKSIRRKLRARSRAEAVAIGFQRGILRVDSEGRDVG